MTSILFNNRFAKSYQTLSDSTLKSWAAFSDYRTRFSALSNYSKGLVTNALYSKTTAAALVVMAAGAGIALWHRYRKPAETKGVLAKPSFLPSRKTQSVATTLRTPAAPSNLYYVKGQGTHLEQSLRGMYLKPEVVQRIELDQKSAPPFFESHLTPYLNQNIITQAQFQILKTAHSLDEQARQALPQPQSKPVVAEQVEHYVEPVVRKPGQCVASYLEQLSSRGVNSTVITRLTDRATTCRSLETFVTALNSAQSYGELTQAQVQGLRVAYCKDNGIQEKV